MNPPNSMLLIPDRNWTCVSMNVTWPRLRREMMVWNVFGSDKLHLIFYICYIKNVLRFLFKRVNVNWIFLEFHNLLCKLGVLFSQRVDVLFVFFWTVTKKTLNSHHRNRVPLELTLPLSLWIKKESSNKFDSGSLGCASAPTLGP